ncbi:FCD domain-containing protein [Streptomyces noursei]|uniref:FCD domain-containing protein n=1 Tax=Streptomyces noursei TaxID=1971 RepID=UPI0037F6D6F8
MLQPLFPPGRPPSDLLVALEALLVQRATAWKHRDQDAWIEATYSFHQAIADATGNTLLGDLYTALSPALRHAMATHWSAPGCRPRRTQCHRQHRCHLWLAHHTDTEIADHPRVGHLHAAAQRPDGGIADTVGKETPTPAAYVCALAGSHLRERSLS